MSSTARDCAQAPTPPTAWTGWLRRPRCGKGNKAKWEPWCHAPTEGVCFSLLLLLTSDVSGDLLVTASGCDPNTKRTR
jgi:hypothetical protein